MAKRVRRVYSLAVKNRRKLRPGAGCLVHVVVGLRPGGRLSTTRGFLRYAGGAFERRPALSRVAESRRVATRATRKTAEGVCSLHRRARASRSERAAALRVRRVPDSPYDDDPPRTRADDLRPRWPRRFHRSRTRAPRRRARPRDARSRARRPGVPPWSGSPRPVPRSAGLPPTPHLVELLGRVGRQPDQQVGGRAARAPRPHGHVVLAEVHAVRA